MIDLHCHLIPGIDDGAKSMAEALEMMRIAQGDGIKTIVCTPHYYEGLMTPSIEEIQQNFLDLRRKAEANSIDLELILGQEVFLTPDIPENIKNGEILKINQHTQYLLVEFPHGEVPRYAKDIIFNLLVEGIVPILAHPERNISILKEPNILKDLIDRGVLVQLNASSLTGLYGEWVAEGARTLVKHKMVHFLGTDAHATGRRGPFMRKATYMIEDIAGKKLVRQLTEENPAKILSGKKIEVEKPLEVQTTRPSFFRRIWENAFLGR